MLGLRFCARAFSSWRKWGPLFIAMRGPLIIAASLVAEHRLQTRRLSSCGARAQLLRGMWDLPRPGLEPVSPALAGRLSTTAPPGKPMAGFYTSRKNDYFCLPYFLLGTYSCSITVSKAQSLKLVLSPSGTCRLLIIYTLTREGFKSCTRRKSGWQKCNWVLRARAPPRMQWEPSTHQAPWMLSSDTQTLIPEGDVNNKSWSTWSLVHGHPQSPTKEVALPPRQLRRLLK